MMRVIESIAYSIPSHDMSKPYTVMLEVAGQLSPMEIDIGAFLSLFLEVHVKNCGLRKYYYQQLQSTKPTLMQHCQ